MTTAHLQQLAGNFGIRTPATSRSQTELIRAVQVLRNGEPCFSTDKRYDCAKICEWRQDCRKLRAVWLR